ncbi:thiamine pyrophosphate-binding protein [Mailhella massiliensis]|uniref:thiamine pyrophosphate-binding protein n=1 Tax=Mailhella massiliensis TaxID=1903261 RepID=UPI00235378E3|nr:thiamine pyrophosphate-binding protein [Mailhella massiliensis]
MYTDEKTTQIVIAMLKCYNIKNIVVSPGTCNSCFVGSIQDDSFFNLYSVVDERSAAYFATGLASETDSPVVITCTEATASRNYISAMTEAFYRNLPIVVLTFAHEAGNAYNLYQQHLDRSVTQNDIKLCSVSLPKVVDDKTKQRCELMLNVALTKCMYGRRGPVHIDIMYLGVKFNVQTLPEVKKSHYVSVYDLIDSEKCAAYAAELDGKKVGLFIGSHLKMTDELTSAISKFAEKYHAPVFVDHTSNYHGSHKILLGQICDICLTDNKPDIMLDMGSICGQFSLSRLFAGVDVWRISDIGELRQRAGSVVRFFDCREEFFFNNMNAVKEEPLPSTYYEEICEELTKVNPDSLPVSGPESLPFSGAFVASKFVQKIPAGAVLHVSILNSLRSINFFKFANIVDVVSNVGGFGIDGPVSTLIGQSASDRSKLFFGQIGDLAFFYDMNVLGNRHISNNVRILLVNNGLGVEFRINTWLNRELGKDKIEPFISARGHFGSAKAWAEACGFHYLSAKNKKQYLDQLKEFCHPDVDHFSKPVIFEVITTAYDDVMSVKALRGKPKPVQKNENLKGSCPFSIRVLSYFIPNLEKRKAFCQKHTHKG